MAEPQPEPDDRALAAALARALPPPVQVLARRPSPYASSFPLVELEVTTGDGARLTLVWKDLTPTALLDGARLARGGAAPDPARELRAYELLDGAGLGTPQRVAAVHEPDRAWLFLEAVRGARLEHVGDQDAWKDAARWLARAHRVLAARADALADPAWPPAWTPPPDPAGAASLGPALDAARARVAALPAAIVHGELYATNVLIADDDRRSEHPGGAQNVGHQRRVCALDWETIARGPALLDLAALTAGRWDEPGEPLAEAYRAALAAPPPRDAFLADLDACRMLVAAHWLAAPAGWSPPPEQARDWLADAELIAARMGA